MPDAKKPRTYTPTFDKVAVELIETDPQETAGGLIVPKVGMKDDEVPFTSPLGVVVAVGPDVTKLKAGDKVVLLHHDIAAQTGKANPVSLDGKVTWVIQEKFVTGTLDQ